MARLPFTFGLTVSQSRSKLRCVTSPDT